MTDRAVGEDVEIELGEAPGIRGVQRELEKKRVELVVTNDLPRRSTTRRNS